MFARSFRPGCAGENAPSDQRARFLASFSPSRSLCIKNTSWALIERPYSCAPQAVGAVYDRPGFFVQSHRRDTNKTEHHHIANTSQICQGSCGLFKDICPPNIEICNQLGRIQTGRRPQPKQNTQSEVNVGLVARRNGREGSKGCDSPDTHGGSMKIRITSTRANE